MTQKKKRTACISLSTEAYHKLHTLIMVRREFFCDYTATISGIVDKAVIEYFENHQREINEIMKLYHKKGGCAEL